MEDRLWDKDLSRGIPGLQMSIFSVDEVEEIKTVPCWLKGLGPQAILGDRLRILSTGKYVLVVKRREPIVAS